MLDDPPRDWRERECLTQQQGDFWHEGRQTTLLFVPSAVVPIANSPDVNVLVNHTHPDAGKIKIAALQPFSLTPGCLKIAEWQSARVKRDAIRSERPRRLRTS